MASALKRLPQFTAAASPTWEATDGASDAGLWAHVISAADLGAFLMREEAGWSQDEVAEQLGIDRRYVYQIESGTPTLYTTRLFGLLRLLGVWVEVHRQ